MYKKYSNVAVIPIIPRLGKNDKLHFRYGEPNIPHDKKRAKGGEDAFLASSDLLVVADGVGGWASKGVDPALFSK